MNTGMIVALLTAHGVRPTANRIIVAETLDKAERPLSLTELEGKIGTIDKSNVFRALMVFREAHLVHVLEDGSDGVRYELCRSHDEHEDDDLHVHFYCERCQRTFCLTDTPVPHVALPEGYVQTSVNYVVKGLCEKCRK